MSIRTLLSRFVRKIYKNPQPSLYNLDQKLAKYLNFKGGFFIEAGANDGYSQSNTYFLEKKKDWRGILIEGIPELYKQCVQARPRSVVMNFALVSNDFQHSTVKMHYAHLMSVVDGSLKNQEAQGQYLKEGVDVQHLGESYSTEVPAKTLASILDSMKDMPGIDFFSLDVEGYELNVLKGLDIDRYRPRYILVETVFFADEIHAFLRDHEYELVEKMSPHDWFYRCQKKDRKSRG